MWERNNREEEQVEIMPKETEDGKPLCFGKDSRKLERDRKSSREMKCKSKLEESKFNTSQKQSMAGGSSTNLEKKL